MRIALISEDASPLGMPGGVDSGGQNVYVGQVARSLASSGHAVDVFTRRDAPDLPEVIEWHEGARIINVPAGPARFVAKEDLLPFMGGFKNHVLRYIRRSAGYDLIHANFWMSGLVAADIKQVTGTPFVITFHALGRVRLRYQGSADRFPVERLEIEDRVAREADRVIAECPQDEQDLRDLYRVHASRIRIVPCGVDPSEFSPVDRAAARSTLGLDPAEKIILQLGRMVRRKGIDTVVRALSILQSRGVQARLLVVGGESDQPDPVRTPEIGRLRAIARERGVEERVTFTGRRGRSVLKHYYSAADVFVTTPWYEPFGMTPLESMACGTPVIGSRVGGIKFTVKDGATGYLVPPDDDVAVAGRIEHLLHNPGLARLLGRLAVAHVNTYFTWRRVVDALMHVYGEVLAPAPMAGGIAQG